MAARFKTQAAKHVVAFNANDDFFVAAQFTGRVGHDLGPPAFALTKFGVHAQQIACKQSGFIPTSAGANF